MCVFDEITAEIGDFAPLFAAFDAVFGKICRRDIRELCEYGRISRKNYRDPQAAYTDYLIKKAISEGDAEKLCCRLYSMLRAVLGKKSDLLDRYRDEMIGFWRRADKKAFEAFEKSFRTD